MISSPPILELNTGVSARNPTGSQHHAPSSPQRCDPRDPHPPQICVFTPVQYGRLHAAVARAGSALRPRLSGRYQRARRHCLVPRWRSTSKGGDTTRMARPTRQRSGAKPRRRKCSARSCVTPNRRQWPATRPTWTLVRSPLGNRRRTASLPDALRAGDGCTANSWNKSNLLSHQGLPTLWLECRFCLSSPSAEA